MASPIGIKSAADYHRGSLSESSTVAAPYRDSFDADDEETSESGAERTRPGFFARVLQAMSLRRRNKLEGDYFSTPREELPDGLLKKRRFRHASPRESRRCRRGFVGTCLKKLVLGLPVLVLVAFGVLHLVQVLWGQEHLLWSGEDYDEYLPDWGKPGHAGDGLSGYPTDATRDVIPIACHSHNDYWRRVPLFDAIRWGCTGVEADVWLFDEELYVGHNTAALTKNRTFRNLYVNPIVSMLDKMNQETAFSNTSGHGIFDADPERSLILLVDFKTNGRETFPFVSQQLSALREKDYLTYWDGERVHSRAVTVVGTGNTPFDMIVANTTHRDIFFDAPLDRFYESETAETAASSSSSSSSKRQDSNSGQSSSQGSVGTESLSLDAFDPSSSYYASVSFTHAVGFVWRGRLSSSQLDTIRGQIRGAHRRGLRVRYWDTPTWPVNLRNHVWHVLMKEGADMLNVDDLRGAAVENWKARVHGFW